MHIEYIILDGFKSYSTRTVIGPLDPHFNAVTGLNGSGKSNVLDSLCFVFGITDLSTVRANKLDELIYKQGQAGITRASVTIIINNSQLNSQLMHPYNTMKEITITRQIVIGGKNRYFINNHPATPKNIFDFYNTASMNVNNARFLIMQGRVTKVVNMKPKELLDLIEEASGTRIYENKKTVALRLIKRKDEKMQEIEKIINDDISPMMQKLKNDKDDFLKYSTVKDEYDRLKKIQVQLQYNYYRDILNELESNFNNKRDEMDNNLASKKDMEKLVQTLNEKLVEEQKALQLAQKKVDSNTSKVDTLSKALSKLKSNRKILDKDYKELVDSMEQTNKEIELQTSNLTQFGSVDAFDEFAKKVEVDRKKLQELQELANTGGRVGQMSQLKSKISSCSSELSNSERVVAHLEFELKKNEQKLKEFDESKSNYDSQIKELQEKKLQIAKEIKELRSKLAQYGDGDVVSDLQSKLSSLKEKRNMLEHDLCMNEQDMKRFKVSVNLPDRGDDYFGQIFDVLSLNELGILYSVPIHVLVGYKFNYLVASNSKYARNMFKLNNFSRSARKVTIVPLNDIKVNYLLTQEDLRQIKSSLNSTGEKGGNDVLGYWDVFEYEERFLRLVQYISGNCVFCSNDADARRIAYSKDLRKRFATATLQGDKYDTSGTMSGGGNKYLSQILKTVSLIRKSRADLECLDREAASLRESVEACKALNDELFELKSRHEFCTSDLLSLEMRLKGGEYFALAERISSAKSQLELKRGRICELREEKRQYERELAELERSGEGDLEDKIRLLKESLRKASGQLELLREQNVDEQLKKSTLEHQINSHKQELESKRLQKDVLEQMKGDQDAEIRLKEDELRSLRGELEDDNARLREVQKAIESVSREREKLGVSIDEANLAIKQLGYDLEGLEKDMSESQVRVLKLERENPGVTDPANQLVDLQFLTSRTGRSSVIDTTRSLCLNESSRDLSHGHKATRRLTNPDLNGHGQKESTVEVHRTTDRDVSVEGQRESESGKSSRRESFGVSRGGTKSDLAYVNGKLERLQRLKERLSRRINQKAQQMYDNILYEYNDLMRKLSRVQSDRSKIERTIAELDKKKKQSVDEMFARVNEHFAQIFSLLLNNATCKLVPTDGRNISSGITMRICFNNVWKNSLSELSGGQRSLLALSLILAMLKVKPAPIYILDEIDAALDLSHTQNIGKMVKQQFRYSQFIIISLKEGMFNNANLLFKVKFLNGRSTITRHPNPNLAASNTNTAPPSTSSEVLESQLNPVDPINPVDGVNTVDGVDGVDNSNEERESEVRDESSVIKRGGKKNKRKKI